MTEPDKYVNEFFDLWKEENGENCNIPHELARELIDIYRTTGTYFKVEHKNTLTHIEYLNELNRLAKEHRIKESERIANENYESNLKVIMRQTNYDREMAINSLKKNGTIDKCIEEYLEVKPAEVAVKSTNQNIYSSIRNWMSKS